jgi:glycerophosphoryl diester phosphodiesterase
MTRIAITIAAIAACIVTFAPARAAAMEVISHRGTAYRPENTLAGISNADHHAADTVEVDVRETADGYLKLMHDTILESTTTCTGTIGGRTSASLRDCRVVERWPWYRRRSASYDGRWRIPSLQAAVTRAGKRGIPLLLDVKTGARNPRLLANAHAATVPVTLQVRSVEDVAWLTGRTGLPVGYCCVWPGNGDLDELAATGASHVSLSITAATADRVNAAHAAGLDVFVWTYRAQNRWLPDGYRSDGSKRARGDVSGYVADTAVAVGADAVHADEPNHVR